MSAAAQAAPSSALSEFFGARSEIEHPPLESSELLELELPAAAVVPAAAVAPAVELELPPLALAPPEPPAALVSTVFVHCASPLHVAPSAAHLQFADVVHHPSLPEPAAVAARQILPAVQSQTSPPQAVSVLQSSSLMQVSPVA